MNEVFSEKKTFGNEAFKITKLKVVVERMLESCGTAASERMLDPEASNPETCKVTVCVAPESGMRAGAPACLRTYKTDTNGLPDCTIAEAICSSFAVSGLFKPMDVVEPGGIKSTYVGLSSFNPMDQLLDEATHLFQNGHLACVVSIGAAQKQASATECERVAQSMLVRFMNRPDHYFRLSVSQGMENIKTIDWERRSEGTAHARSYLSVSENDDIIGKIARAVLKKNKGVPTMHLRKLQLWKHTLYLSDQMFVLIGGSIPEASSITHTIKLCPPPSSLFVGRGDLLSRIGRCLGDIQGQRVCVVHGLGGVGKTQLALKYVETHANDHNHIFYVDCTSKHTIEADLKRIALAKNVGDCANDALAWLARLQERWLIVYNNADDTSMNLRGYFPSCSHGSILITTRNRGMVSLARGVDANCQVSSMSEDEAKELLATAAGLAEGVGTPGVALVELLGRFPLAIVQAGAYVQTNMCSIQEYLEMYQTSRGQILEDYASEVQKADDYELTVYATWQVSYRRLSPLAKQLYCHLSFIHHDHITENIFRFAVLGLKDEPHPLPPTDEETKIEGMTAEFLANFTRLVDGTWDKAVFLRTLKDLTSYSLITYDEANRSYSIHPLVQQWTRTVIAHPDTTCGCVAFLLASSVTSGRKTEDYAHHRMLLNHVDRLPDSEKLKPRLAWRLNRVYADNGRAKDEERLVKAEYEANLRALGRDNPYTLNSMENLAVTYSSQGRLGEAEELEQEVVEIKRRLWGNEDPTTLHTMGNLALTYWKQGRLGEAEVLQREVLEMRKQVLGDEDPSTLEVMGNLGATYSSQGRWAEAEVLQREVVAGRKRISGNEHPGTLREMGNLAATHWSQGRWGEAEVLQVEVVEVRKRVSGDKHPDTLHAMENLAMTYLRQGRWDEAEALQRKMLEVRKQVSGDEHPDTLMATGNLAETYWNQERFEEAEVLQRAVVAVRKQISGAEHPDTLVQMGNLAMTCLSQGQWGEAEVLLREVLEAGRRTSGGEHPATLRAMGNLAATYGEQGRWGEAEVLEREVVELWKRVSGDEHPSTLIAMGNLATTYSRQGRWREAEVLEREAAEVRKRVWGSEHPDTLIAMENLAMTYSRQGQWGQAEVLQREVLEARRRVSGNEHRETLHAMGHLASTYSEQGRWGEAEVLQQEMLEARKKVLGDKHTDTLVAMGNLAVTYLRQGRWGEAEALLREVVEVRKRVSGDAHPATLSAMGKLAMTYLNQGQWGEAEELQQEVAEVTKRVSGDEHPDTLIEVVNLARIYSDQGRWEEAEVLLREVVEIRKRVSGDAHPDTLTAIGNLAATYADQGRWREAEMLQREVVEVRKRVSGDKHPETLTAIGNLATTYLQQERWEEAEVLEREAVEVWRRVSGDEHPDTLISMVNLAVAYLNQGRWREAEVLQREVVVVSRRVSGNEHPDTLSAMGNLASIYWNQGRWDEAEVLQQEVVEVRKRMSGNEHPSTLLAMGNLARTYSDQGRHEEAEVLLREVVEVGERVWGNAHPYTLGWTRCLEGIRRHLAQSDMPPATLSAVADPLAWLLETSRLDTVQATETSDNAQSKREGRMPPAFHDRQYLMLWSFLVSHLLFLLCYSFWSVPPDPV
ncbi:hypothetical protein FRC09_018872 [Ceratobasidium sp. 395]|nr:hypothetical protein FRC09_018872 [Ceratobasidium sp. 395]